MNNLNANYWTHRYEQGMTGWDAGKITTPLKEYFDHLDDKSCKMLIPGCGNAYEAAYLHQNGFINVFLADISSYPLEKFANENPGFPEAHMLHIDFFDIDNKYDLIVEQTFFCALDPSLRPSYAKKSFDLLKPSGRLVGVLFDDKLYEEHPPYGGNPTEYETYFRPYFHFDKWERCYNSIKPRQGREWFINLRR